MKASSRSSNYVPPPLPLHPPQTMKMGFAAMSGDEAAMDAASDQASGMASDAAANGAAAAMEHGPALVDFAKLLAAEGVKGYKEHQANQENNRHEEQGHQGWGSDADEHGCRASSGYSWCAPKNKCMRAWEGSCEYDQQHQRNSDRLPSGWSSAVALDRWDRKTYYFCSAVPIERRESAQWERPTQPCSESTHSKNAGNRQCTYRDNNLRNNGPRCYMEGVNECAGQCLTHAFRPSYYTNGVCYATMSQCTSGITAQNNWMSATGHYRCYQNERGRCVAPTLTRSDQRCAHNATTHQPTTSPQVRAEGPEATPRQAPGRPRLLQHAGGLRELWRRPQVARARLNDAPDRFGGRGGARGGEPGALRLGFLFLQVNLK